jgi:hypothetical protein
MAIKQIVKLTLICCLLGGYSYGQRITIKSIESRLITHQGVEFVGELKDKNNDLYSYPNWSNEGVLFLDSTEYKLSNINFNISTNSFESRIDRKKLFSFKNSLIDSVAINNHLFIRVRNSFYEVLLENGKNQFLKLHSVKYQEGTVNRLDGTVGESRKSVSFKYLIKFDNAFLKIELGKKSILALITDKDSLMKFVRKERLSYKKEKDIIKMLGFIFENSNNIVPYKEV